MRTFVLGLLMFISPLSPAFLSQSLSHKNSAEAPKIAQLKVYASAPLEVPSNSRSSDWDLVIINRNNQKRFPTPKLTTIGGKQIDSRIAAQTMAFLKAAQTIDAREHIISGYRSPDLQDGLYEEYIQEEMASQHISREKAIKIVQTYSQPAGASEHETGLAMDMSCTNTLDTAPADVVQKLEAIAPQYGFILRFPEWGKSSTGIGYEDWHWRYVGVENAKYIYQNHLTLEEYVALLIK